MCLWYLPEDRPCVIGTCLETAHVLSLISAWRPPMCLWYLPEDRPCVIGTCLETAHVSLVSAWRPTHVSLVPA